ERGPTLSTGIAEEHQDRSVGRPCGPLGMVAGRENALAAAVRTHDPDRELPPRLLGEGDEVAFGRPHRSRIGALPVADALGATTCGRHHVDLRLPAAIGLKADL